MKKILLTQLLFGLVIASSALTVRADDEQDQFAILHSTASVSDKWKACQKLRVIGTEKAVPEVAALLTDKDLSQAARQTLEGLPYPEADAALHDALGKTDGLVKAGIVDSIGWRGKPEALPYLLPLLTDTSSNVAAATATAVGRLGGAETVTALSAIRDQPPANVQAAVLASLLKCAERFDSNNDTASAIAVYRDLNNDKYPMAIRTAAWRGLIASGAPDQIDLMYNALTGTDRALERVALKVLRVSTDHALLQGCVDKWASLPVAAQLAVVDTEVKLGNDALPIVKMASQSEQPAVREAAWKADGDLNDLASIAALAHAAASSQGDERDAARDSLSRMRGPNAADALLAELDHAATPEKVELIRALGARPDASVAKALVTYAGAGDDAVRKAALESLTKSAPPDAFAPLLSIAQQPASDDVKEQTMEALAAICQASPDKDAATHAVLDAQKKLPASDAGEFLPLLAQLGTPDALTAVQAAIQNPNVDQAKDAVRALSQWPNAAPAPALLDLSRTTKDNALRILALRGAITVAGTEPSNDKRLALLKEALAEAKRPDEKKQALGLVGQVPTPEALDLAMASLSDPDISNEASLAVVEIAEKLHKSNPELAQKASVAILEKSSGGDLFKRAWALRSKGGKKSPFIREWLVCGPYFKAGVSGATAIFSVPFGPELPDQQVDWKPVPAGNSVPLAAMFPGAENCDAYLRTSIIVPEDCSAVLLTGSDDGIKAWLNGKVVHSNNVDRGEVADQDAAPIKLKQGANELICKISQGGAGWSACARIVGINGKSIPGLKAERPTGAAGALTASE